MTFTASTKASAIVIALSTMMGMSSACADEAQAKGILKAMSDYLASQKAISFDFDSLPRGRHQSRIRSSGWQVRGTVTLNRPDKLRATRTGGFANVELVFDGKTLTLLGKSAKAYAQVDAPGTIDHLVDELRTKYQRPVPAADLLMSDPYGQLMPEVVDTKDLGSGVIRGVECDHLAFRTNEVDWQIWVAQGKRSLSVPLCHHQQEDAGISAIHHRH